MRQFTSMMLWIGGLRRSRVSTLEMLKGGGKRQRQDMIWTWETEGEVRWDIFVTEGNFHRQDVHTFVATARLYSI